MRLSEMIADMSRKFPNQAAQIIAWMPEYKTALERFEGERLAEAYRVCMTGWTAGWAPKAAHISPHMPGKVVVANQDELSQRVAQTTREHNQRVEAANQWWKDHNHEVGLFWEYQHRSKYGEPGPEDYERFEMHKRVLESSEVLPVPGFKTVERGIVKPNHVPMARAEPEQRDVARDPSQDVPAAPSDAGEVADSGVQPPEPPPLQGPEEYGAVR